MAAVAASTAAIQSPASSSTPAAAWRARPVSRSRSERLSWAHSPGTGPGSEPRTSESATLAAAAAPMTLPAARRRSISCDQRG